MAEPLRDGSIDEPGDDSATARMGFLEHLDELRTRIIRSCLAIAGGMVIALFFVDRVADFILAPSLSLLPAGTTLMFTRPGEGFSFYLDVSFIGGGVLAAPFVLYQVWRFIAPGLYAKEKRFAVPFVVLTTIGTVGGALFSHYILFPSTMAFFGKFDSTSIKFMPRLEDTFELYKKLLIGMVLIFQIPTLVFFLAKMRLVTAGFLWRNLKYAVLISFIVAALLTSSPDPWNQAIFAAPMIGLYVISVGIAWLVGRTHGQDDQPPRTESHGLKLVFTAAVLEQARRQRPRAHEVRQPTRLRRL
jgi:sec-independent protein translocase protein TatC